MTTAVPELPPTAGLPIRWADFFREPANPFPRGLRQWLGLPQPIIACSGTASLVVALTTLRRLKPDRTEVVVPAYTCPLVALAAALVPGLRVIACDTLPGGFDFDPAALDALCDAGTLAVVPTHLGGRVADVAAAVSIAGQCGAAVIEDAAQAMGAFSDGASVGLAGDIGFFSLAVGKGLTMYEGGVLFSRDPALATELRDTAGRLLRPGLLWNARRVAELLGYALVYRPDRLGLVYGRHLRKKLAERNEVEAVGDYFTPADVPLHRPDILRLRVAANALERLPGYLDAGRKRALERLTELRRLNGATVVADRAGGDGVWPFFMLLFPRGEQRDRALDALWQKGFGVSKLFVHALPDYAYLAPMLEPGPESPNARDFAARTLTVTNSHWLDDATFHRIVDILRSCL